MIADGFRGLAALAADLVIAPEHVASAIRPTLLKAGRSVAESMRAHVPDPVTTEPGWQVRPTITSDRTTSRDETGNLYVEAGAGHFVARFLEGGTVHMAPRPFVDVSVEENLDEFEVDVAEIAGRL